MLGESMASMSFSHSDTHINSLKSWALTNFYNHHLAPHYTLKIHIHKFSCVSWKKNTYCLRLTNVNQLAKNSFDVKQNVQTLKIDFHWKYFHKTSTNSKKSHIALSTSFSLELKVLMKNLSSQYSLISFSFHHPLDKD